MPDTLPDTDRQQSIAEALAKTYDGGRGLDLPLSKFVEVFDAELAATGYTVTATGDPFHVIEFREDGWHLHHPLACRPNLTDCYLVPHCHHIARTPTDGYGRYQVLDVDAGGGLVLAHLSP